MKIAAQMSEGLVGKLELSSELRGSDQRAQSSLMSACVLYFLKTEQQLHLHVYETRKDHLLFHLIKVISRVSCCCILQNSILKEKSYINTGFAGQTLISLQTSSETFIQIAVVLQPFMFAQFAELRVATDHPAGTPSQKHLYLALYFSTILNQYLTLQCRCVLSL